MTSRQWKVARVRAACATGLVLMALCALTPEASGMPGAWPRVTVPGNTEMRSGGGQFVPAAIPGSGHQYTGHQTVQRAAIQPAETAIRPGETFDWADAGVGAAFTAMLGALVAFVVLLNRRWTHAQLPAGSRP